MKTSIKILLLVFFSIAAIAGVLIFEKTRVAPPSNLKLVDQYAKSLQSECASLDAVPDFATCHSEYVRIDDKIQRFYAERVLTNEVSDDCRKKIDNTYGKSLTSYAFDLLQKSVWPEDKLNDILLEFSTLKGDKLTNGEKAVSDDFISSANKFASIIDDYKSALRLSQNTSYRGIGDASSKISKAKSYMTADYLKNNASLVNALDVLPDRIAQSHYKYVDALVSSLSGYYYVTKDYYMNTLIPKVDKAINEYKATKIYGNQKRSISDLELKAERLVTDAMKYYVRSGANVPPVAVSNVPPVAVSNIKYY
jgi:hypothetical protein